MALDGLEFRILGTLEVWRGGETVPIPAARQRDVLVVLLLHANRVVATERLIELVWGEDPPATARGTLHTLVRRLRRQLAGTPARAEEVQRVLQTRPPGYRLVVPPDRLDVSRFERLRREGREALAGGDAGAAAGLLGQAVALWRGTALADVSAIWLLRVEQPRLQEQYLQAVEDRIDAELARGRHAEVLAELRRLIAEHPLRERPHGQLMTALYRSGRQAESLATYRRLRQVLAGELGVEPGPALQRLHQAVLRGDLPPAASAAAGGGPDGSAAEVRPAQLPADAGTFTGRTDELARLDKLLAGAGGDPVPAAAVVGTTRVGRTKVVVHWAKRMRKQFPDGQLYIDLQGYATVAPVRPVDALGQFLRALGVPADRVPDDPQEAAALYRTQLAERRVLVVLDNARNPDQVRPLLPGSSGCLAVVTSRDRLDGLVARDGAYRLSLDVLAPAEAESLLRRTIDADALAGDEAGIAELARLCGYLPLALRIAAANLSGRRIGVASYARRLRTGGELAGLVVAGDERTAVRSAFALSYASLPDGARRLFRMIGVFPGTELTAEAAAALIAVGVPAAGRLLEQLAAAHLVYEPVHGRYRCHDLLRDYAVELAAGESEADRCEAITRLGEWYLASVDRAARLLYPELVRMPSTGTLDGPPWTDSAEALRWLEAERRNLVQVVRHAAAHGPRWLAYRLADGMRGYFQIRRHVADSEAVYRAGVTAAEAARDRLGQAASLLGLAEYHRQQHRYPEAIDHFVRAGALSEQAGWLAGQAAALTHLGAVYGETGQLAVEVEHVTRALAICQRIGNWDGVAACLGNLGVACFELGRLAEAADYYERALELDRSQGSRLGQAYTLNGLGEAYLEMDRLGRARECLTEALALFREVGSPIGESHSMAILATVCCREGDQRRAGELADSALAVLRGTGDGDAYTRWGEAIARNALAVVHRHAGQPGAAIAEHQRALQAVRDGGNPYPEVETLLGLAAANLALAPPAPSGRAAPPAPPGGQATLPAPPGGQATPPDPVAGAGASSAPPATRSGASAAARPGAAGEPARAGAPDTAARAYASQALTIARDRGYRLLEQRAEAVLARCAAPTG